MSGIETIRTPTSPDMATRQEMMRTGVALLMAGRAREARSIFESLFQSGEAGTGLLVALALACRADNDPDKAATLVDRVLGSEPNNVRALLLKGDLLAAEGNSKGAVRHYRTAKALVGNDPNAPIEIRNELQRTEAFCLRQASEIESILATEFIRAGLDPQGAAAGERFAESVELLFERKELFFQAPKYYFFPGLAHRQFFSRAEFPFLDDVENATDAIRAEVLKIMQEDRAFEPYVKKDPARPHDDQLGMADNPGWSAYYLWKDGKPIPENLARCPETAEVVDNIPLCVMPGRAPSVLFSRLLPGARIPPHNGMVNTRLICHLPLIVPPGCGFRVGNETREWREGKAWVFDDSIEHEAWNDSNETRVILLFEIWRPELSDAERTAILALFKAIDVRNGAPPRWEI